MQKVKNTFRTYQYTIKWDNIHTVEAPGKKKERQKRAEGVFKEIMAEKAKWKYELLIWVQLFSSPWTVAHQAPLSMGFSRQEYWSGQSFPSPGDLPDLLQGIPEIQVSCISGRFFTIWALREALPGIKPGPPALAAWSLNHWTMREVLLLICLCQFNFQIQPGTLRGLRSTFYSPINMYF